MNYPKEAVEAIRRLFQSDSPVSVIINYAAWAHEQLRPRKLTEERPPPPVEDPFEEHWNKVWDLSGASKGVAREFYDLGVKVGKEGK